MFFKVWRLYDYISLHISGSFNTLHGTVIFDLKHLIVSTHTIWRQIYNDQSGYKNIYDTIIFFESAKTLKNTTNQKLTWCWWPLFNIFFSLYAVGKRWIHYLYFLSVAFQIDAWFGLVLWHINHCRLFNAKSGLLIYIRQTPLKNWPCVISCPSGGVGK